MHLGKRLVVLVILLCGWISSSAQDQEAWSLERCISHAIDNNIQIKQSALQKESARLDKNQSLAQLFPSLNASTSFNTNFGRNIDLATNNYINEQTNSNSFYVGSSIPLFNGFRLLNGFKQSQIDLLAAEHDLQGLTNDIVMNIATAFMQVMFNEELLLVAQEQLDVTAEQLTRTQKLVDAGSLPAGNVFDVEAQFATNELQVINMENALSASVLTLKQMLNLNTSETFRIERPSIVVPIDQLGSKTVGTVYDHALQNWPKIKSRESNLESARKGEKIAFASYTPTLSGSVSVSTRYSSAAFLGDPDPYSTQLDQNLGESIGLSLNIPIFNALQSRTTVKKSHLNRINAELLLQDEKNQLYATVQQAYNDAQAAKRQFDASDKSVTATQRAFEYAEQRYEVGMMNSLEFSTASNNLARSKSELLRSKFDYIFKMKVLDFYQGKPITFDQTK
ncbi:MAG: outer membrane protein [Bacteroidia bacterium]|jgi:outer membrane protein